MHGLSASVLFKRSYFIDPPDFLEILSAQEPEKEMNFPTEIPRMMTSTIPSALQRVLYTSCAPIGNPEPRDFTPLDTPYIFPENGTQTVKMQFDTIPQNILNRCTLHPCEDENYSGFYFAALIM
ncbi:MAG: hypothetical protein IJX14_07805 [Clostridia bacterium]|nr:hypothetical protein [Clostridia bacterium]